MEEENSGRLVFLKREGMSAFELKRQEERELLSLLTIIRREVTTHPGVTVDVAPCCTCGSGHAVGYIVHICHPCRKKITLKDTS